MNVAFVGLGAVGQEVLRCLTLDQAPVCVLGALVAHPERKRTCRAFSTLDELLDAKPDLIVECARQHVLEALGPRILASGRSLLLTSVGALASERIYDALKQAACKGGAQILVPGGALAGIDALAAARHIGISTVCYTRRAPPSTWVKSGALEAADAAALVRPKTIFEGNARVAARQFPKNANITATVALAGVGFDRTQVTLLADPSITSNVHVLEAEGDFGRLSTEMSARPIAGSTSSAIVAGSLTRAVLSGVGRMAI